MAIEQRVKGLAEDFWRFHSKWINDAAQEVRYSLLSSNLVAHFSGVKWSENATEYRGKELEESRKVLCSKISTSLEKIRLDLYIIAMGEFREVTRVVRTPISFSANLF